MEDRAPASLVKENGVEVIRIGDLPPEEAERYLRVESQDVAVDLTALYSLIAPGTTVTAASAQPEGFGRYTLTVETEAWLTGETSQRSGELGPHADGFLAHSSPGRSILEIMESAESGRVSDKTGIQPPHPGLPARAARHLLCGGVGAFSGASEPRKAVLAGGAAGVQRHPLSVGGRPYGGGEHAGIPHAGCAGQRLQSRLGGLSHV